MERSFLRYFLAMFLAFAIFPIADAQTDDASEFESLDCYIEDFDPGLGGGADFNWVADGRGELDAGGESALTNVVIQGRRDGNIRVHVEAWARFGPQNIPIFENYVEVAAEESTTIQLDFIPALGIHEKQSAYVTAVYARATEVRADGNKGYSKFLSGRFMAWYEAEDRTEVFDKDTLKTTYPGGVFGENERAVIEALASEEDGAVLLFVEPGIPVIGEWLEPADAGSGEEERS